MSLKVFEGFAGYGGGSFAFKKLMKMYPNYNFEVVGYSEIDKYASNLFDLNHKDNNGNPIKNYGDITQINPSDLPDFDLQEAFLVNHFLQQVCNKEKMTNTEEELCFII